MDESYLLAAVRYIELNPVLAGLAKEPWLYLWSNARAHLTGKDDNLAKVTPLLKMVKDWREFLLSAIPDKEIEELRKHELTGRPLGGEHFVKKLEKALGRILRRQKPGRKKEKDEQK